MWLEISRKGFKLGHISLFAKMVTTGPRYMKLECVLLSWFWHKHSCWRSFNLHYSLSNFLYCLSSRGGSKLKQIDVQTLLKPWHNKVEKAIIQKATASTAARSSSTYLLTWGCQNYTLFYPLHLHSTILSIFCVSIQSAWFFSSLQLLNYHLHFLLVLLESFSQHSFKPKIQKWTIKK